jgi:hypothetical protein
MTRKVQLVAFIVLLGAIRGYASTVVTVVTRDTIVICADGKISPFSNQISPPKLPGLHKPGQKLYVINDRYVISHTGIYNFLMYDQHGNRMNFPYSSERFIHDVRSQASAVFSLERIADIMRANLISEFRDFDVVPKSGSLKPEHLPPPHDEITIFEIAGFDGQSAHVYRVEVDIDWKSLAHVVPPIKTLYPDARKNLSLFVTGYHDVALELRKPTSSTARKFAQDLPAEYAALVGDLYLSPSQMVALARRLVELEIERNPAAVGYPVTVITIPLNGSITTRRYPN